MREVRRSIRAVDSDPEAWERALLEELRLGLGAAPAADREPVPPARDGRCRLDLALADGRPQNPLLVAGQLIVARRDGGLDEDALGELLERVPALVVVGRAYERVA